MDADSSELENKHIRYADAGVDIHAGKVAVHLISDLCKKTQGGAVRHAKGQFAALYALSDIIKTYRNPLLVSSTDGVGTKLRIAQQHNCYETIGRDCVAMCVNDIACHGAMPLFFLDYIACGALSPPVVKTIVAGMVEACCECNCSLIGGEMAEMPGMYAQGDYDVAGFTVGVVDECNVVDGSCACAGDAVIGLASSGIHSNGFSLIRALYPDTSVLFDGAPLYQTLLKPTRLYVRAFQALVQNLSKDKAKENTKALRALVHITGGGIFENIARVLPSHICAHIHASSVPSQAIFRDIEAQRSVSKHELWRTFNMGIGAAAIVSPHVLEDALRLLREAGETAFVAGQLHHRKGENNPQVLLL